MLEAFIIDRLKKTEEQQWEEHFPTIELPLESEEQAPPKKEEEKIWILDLR